ncbi:condensin-2 complex subunit D3 [Thalictrum thalictroides]|uniref:Condensin-2 complex subunit D3 n=1 Tax=Thalictrum thalictroides TaxID=46969 RepID=A0A7J6UUP1_THATH|nr:condensin-2 complex subunit D3 [Thalictrum thalictroides]
MEEVFFRITSELETLNNLNDPSTTISESTLSDLQTLFANALDADDTEDIDRLWDELASKNISPASLARYISSSMDSGPTHHTLLASQVYLSLLLSPNSPVLSLFNPVAFISLLSSIRRFFKKKQLGDEAGDSGSRGQVNNNKKKKGGGAGGGRGVRRNAHAGEGDEIDTSRFDFRLLFPVIEKLESVLCRIHLDRFPDSLKSLIQTVCEVPVAALEFYDNLGSYNRLSELCYRILIGVLKPEHGNETDTAVEVLRSLVPSILLLKSQARTSALRFVTHQMMVVAKGNTAVRKAVVYLPRYLVSKAPERSEPRAAAVESIMEIIRVMEFENRIGFVDYVIKMSEGKTHLRLLAVDLIPMLLMSLPDPLGLNVEDGDENWWGLKCLKVMIIRCSDLNAAIRARSLSNLAQVVDFLFGDVKGRDRLKGLLGFEDAGGRNWEGGLTGLLRKRCMDEKANVRKAALLLITKSTALLGRSVDGILLKTMGIACSDPLVSIRKAAISALSEAFRRFSDESVIIEWLHCVPCLITDNESSIQEEIENLFLELVLDRLSGVGNAGSINSTFPSSSASGKMESLNTVIESVYPGGVLNILKSICDSEVMICTRKICTSLGKKKRLKPAIAVSLQNIIKTSESVWLNHSWPIEQWTAPPGCWFLLSEVSSYLSKAVRWEFLHHHWQHLDKTESNNKIGSPLIQRGMDSDLDGIGSDSAAWAGDRVYLLQTISNVSVELPPEPAAELAHNLLKRLEEFTMHSTEVNAHVKALRTLCKRKALSPEEGDTLVLKWVNQLLSKALRIIEAYITEASDSSRANGFLTPNTTSNRKGRKKKTTPKASLQAVTAVYTVGSLVIISPSADLKGIIPVLHTIITSGGSETKSKKVPAPVSIKNLAPSLYTQSWLTMGKICLADQNLAKRYIPVFVQELEKNDCAALRNNIIVMMADFCVRYTALVDCYISKITNCLRDPCEVVRRQTFILLSKLLQRDYVKWRGVLFLRFLLCLVDDSQKIKQLADFLFGNILKAKAPLLAYNSFVEAIFVLNDCHAHAGHSESQGSQTQSRLFSIRGSDEKSRSQRMHIYVSLLKQMAPEHLLATSAKLCAEILAAASDGLLDLDDITGQSVLQDALQILACKEIRIQSNRGVAVDTTEIEDEGGDAGGTDAAVAARRKLVAQVAKKSLIQNAIPIFIELKRLLESKNSPLIGCLMECLRVLLKDYKNEIDDILVADRQLQKELIYDMQKYDTVKAKSTVVEAVATMQKLNPYRSPLGCRSGPSKLSNHLDVNGKLAEQLGSAQKVASVVGDVAAAATVKSVLREVNRGMSTPQLNSISRPKLKSSMRGFSKGDRPSDVLESLRRRQTFEFGEEN